MSTLLFSVSLTGYLLAMTVYLVFFFSQNDRVRSAARGLFFAAAIVHTCNIIARLVEAGHTPITSVHETISFFAWSVAWCYLSFRWRTTVRNFGTFASIMVAVLMIISAVAPAEILPLTQNQRSWLFPVHASLAIIADAFLALAFIGALMYLLQERELKNKRLGFFFSRLPSLESLDKLNQHCLSIGFILMTLGMFTGYVWARQIWGGRNWHWDPKIVWAMITWFLYAGLMHQRFTMGWRGRRSALVTMLAFCAVVLTLIFLFKGIHHHGA